MHLENIKTSDEDIYECIANNSLGIAVREVRLKVKGGDIQTEDFDNNEILQSISEAKYKYLNIYLNDIMSTSNFRKFF